MSPNVPLLSRHCPAARASGRTGEATARSFRDVIADALRRAGAASNGGFGLAVELDVHIPGLGQPTAEAIVARAHQVYPYSNATRGNIPVTLAVV